eukprot:SAG31_NODE_2580_length_5438_cov_8.500843_5_plen_84_part_00
MATLSDAERLSLRCWRHFHDQFGPTDYAMSIGVPAQDGRDGTPMHPKVAEAERKVISTAMRMNVAVRAGIALPHKLLPTHAMI